MTIQLDPDLKQTFTEVQADLDLISEQEDIPSIVRLVHKVVDRTKYLITHIRVPTIEEKAAHAVLKLQSIEKDLTNKTNKILLERQKKHPELQEEHDFTQKFIKQQIFEKLHVIREAIISQALKLHQMKTVQGFTEDTHNQEIALLEMIDNANQLDRCYRSKKVNERFLTKFIHFHVSRVKLEIPVRKKLKEILSEAGKNPSEHFVTALLTALKSNQMFEFRVSRSRIWEAAKAVPQQEQSACIGRELDTYFDKRRPALEGLITHLEIQFTIERVRYGKQAIAKAIEKEYLKVPLQIRKEFPIFENGVYYASEWSLHELISQLIDGSKSPDEIQEALNAEIKKWTTPAFIKCKFCRVLEDDWNIKQTYLSDLYEAYAAEP